MSVVIDFINEYPDLFAFGLFAAAILALYTHAHYTTLREPQGPIKHLQFKHTPPPPDYFDLAGFTANQMTQYRSAFDKLLKAEINKIQLDKPRDHYRVIACTVDDYQRADERILPAGAIRWYPNRMIVSGSHRTLVCFAYPSAPSEKSVFHPLNIHKKDASNGI